MQQFRSAAVAVARLRAAPTQLLMMRRQQHLGPFPAALMSDFSFQQEYQRVGSE